MRFATAIASFVLPAILAVSVSASPVDDGPILAKRETSFGNPDLVVDQGDKFKVNYGSTDGHPNACPGHYICYIPKSGSAHGDVSLGNPDDFVDEGNRFRLNYGSTSGHPNACDGHYICYINK